MKTGNEETEKSMSDMVETVKKSGGSPQTVWHPRFGYVLRDGKPTPSTLSYYEFITKEKANQ